MRDLIIIGAGGHAKVIADIAIAVGYNVRGFLDDNPNTQKFLAYGKLGNVSDATRFSKSAEFVIAIGNNEVRKSIAEKYDLSFATLIHPTAVIGSQVEIGKGSVVMPLAVINANSKIGKHCIINTAAVIEHDNCFGDYSHISPNATLCGTVSVGSNCHVGAGATVINNTNVCDNCVIGAGAVVIKDIEISGTYIGVPARVIK